MLHKIAAIAVLVLAVAVSAEDAKIGQYTIVGAQHIRFNSKYHVAVSVHNATVPATIRVTIANGGDFQLAKEVTVQPWSTETVAFEFGVLPPPPTGVRYKLIAEGLHGIQFRNETELRVIAKQYSILVQSDKAQYKPGDLIRFRALVIDVDTKPVDLHGSLQIYAQDGAGNSVKQWSNASTPNGVFSGELRLSDEPVLGTWSLGFSANNETRLHRVEVAEYVLPTFEAFIETPADVVYKSGKIIANIRGRYTYGKPVHGEAIVTLRQRYSSWSDMEPTARKVIKVGTKGTVEFDIVDDLHLRAEPLRVLEMHVTFVEKFTGRQQNATTTINVRRQRYDIQRTSYGTIYVDGEPFDVGFQVTQFGNTPVRNETIEVWYSSDFSVKEEIFSEKHQLDNDGSVRVKLNFPLNRYGFFLMVKYEDVTESFGYISVRYPAAYPGSYPGSYPTVYPGSYPGIYPAAYPGSYPTGYRLISPYPQPSPNSYVPEFQVDGPTSELGVGDTVKIGVQSRLPLHYFTYQLIGRGGVLLTKTVKTENATQQKFEIEFVATFAMLPSVKIVVYTFRDDGSIAIGSNHLYLKSSLANSITLEPATNETLPGTNIDLKITTAAKSFVGLLAVDQSVLLLRTRNDLTEGGVTNTLDEYGNKYSRQAFGDSSPYSSYSSYSFSPLKWSPKISQFENVGVFVLSNVPELIPEYNHYDTYGGIGLAHRQYGSGPVAFAAGAGPGAFLGGAGLGASGAAGASQAPPAIRKVFPETWIWDTLLIESADGVQNFHKKVPDTITSWVITAFSLNPATGLGLTKDSSKITVFKSFFVSLSLPYSVKRGEVVSIPIVVFNYLDSTLNAEVTLFNEDGDFEFVEIGNDIEEIANSAQRRIKHVAIKSMDATGVSFMIKPLRVGPLTIKATAISPIAGDGIELLLLVTPEGVPQYVNKAVLVDLRNKSSHAVSLPIVVPANAVPDSTRIEVSAIGDVMGPTIEHLDSLIVLPSGCGEQNMLHFVPNIVILNYLQSVNQLTDEVKQKSHLYMEIGYQRQLTYRHWSGSFSAFGKSDASGSTWLTAFVARSFRQAAEHIDIIEDRIIHEALNFLRNVQSENGSFPEVGTVVHRQMQGGAGQGVALTAYTLLAFLENQHIDPEFSSVIAKATDYVANNLDTLTDVYAMAVAAYALQLANHHAKDEVLRNLDAKALVIGGRKHWELPIAGKDVTNSHRSTRHTSINTEITSYALLAHFHAGHVDQCVPIMKWLLAQRNAQGGFASTQDTVIGLQALATIAARIGFGDGDVQFVLSYEENAPDSVFSVNAANAQVLQQYQLPGDTRVVNVTATGHGFSLLSLAYKYYVNETGAEPRFNVHAEVINIANGNAVRLHVCTSFIPSEETNVSNMAVMEIEFPSGFTYDTDRLSALKSASQVKKVELINGDTVVVLYFDNLGSEPVCPTIEAVRTHKVALLKPAAITVFDYYDTSRKSRVFYNTVQTGLCDICEQNCPDSCNE